jgi:hypothetical protein
MADCSSEQGAESGWAPAVAAAVADYPTSLLMLRAPVLSVKYNPEALRLS